MTDQERRNAATVAFKDRFNAAWDALHVVVNGRCKSCGREGSQRWTKFHHKFA